MSDEKEWNQVVEFLPLLPSAADNGILSPGAFSGFHQECTVVF